MPAANPADDRVYGVVLGKVIAQLRQESDETQGDLARAVGVRQSTISRIEGGQVPDALTLQRIATHYGRSSDELHRLAQKGMLRVEEAARKAAPGAFNGWGGLLAVVGVVALAGLAVFVVAALFAEDEQD